MRDRRTERLVYQGLLRRAARPLEAKRKLSLSVLKNKNQGQGKLAYLSYSLGQTKLKYGGARQVNLCPLNGRSGGYYKVPGLSRHSIKEKALGGQLQNFRTKSF